MFARKKREENGKHGDMTMVRCSNIIRRVRSMSTQNLYTDIGNEKKIELKS